MSSGRTTQTTVLPLLPFHARDVSGHSTPSKHSSKFPLVMAKFFQGVHNEIRKTQWPLLTKVTGIEGGQLVCSNGFTCN
jgi:hypothetical protein